MMFKKKREFYYSTISLIVSILTLLSVFIIRYLDKKEELSIQLVENDTNYKLIESSGAGGNWNTNINYRTKTRTLILSNLNDSKINISKISAEIEYKNPEVESDFCEVIFYNDKNERIFLPHEIESNTSKIIFILLKFKTKKEFNKVGLEAIGANLKVVTTKNNIFESHLIF